ncbi:MAG: hypothetical protein M1355_01190 [Patescibacteria group bacterium]|nr:hypothetical protein [Patescibacteria group bacterium]
MKKFKKKIAVLTSGLLIVQLMMLGMVLPVKTFAADYQAPAASQKDDSDISATSFNYVKANDDHGSHIGASKTLKVDTFDVSAIDENEIKGVSLKIKYKTESDYDGTEAIKYGLEGEELADSKIIPTSNSLYVTEEFDLFSQGIDTKEEIGDLDVSFTNNSANEESGDVLIDYLWVEVTTNEIPQVILTNKPDTLSNETEATFSWVGMDDVTPQEDLLYSYRLDEGDWTDYASGMESTLTDLNEGSHKFDLRVIDEDSNLSMVSYEWEIDATTPDFTAKVTPVLANSQTKTVNFSITPSEEVKDVIPVESLAIPVKALEYGVNLKVEGDGTMPFEKILHKDAKGNYSFDYLIRSKGDKEINFTIFAFDLAGNEGKYEGSFNLDTVAPGKITGLRSVVGNAKAEFSWVNPTDLDLAGIRVVRNDGIGSNLGKVNVFTDTTVKNDTTYTYSFYAYDIAGNIGEAVVATVTPKAPVVAQAAVVDVAPVTELVPPVNEEIKAATEENNDTSENKDVEVKETKKLPTWSIILLIILLGIAAYLFYTQTPKENK